MNRPEPKLMPVFGRLKKHLKVAISPLPEGSGRPDPPPGIEHLSELDHQPVPLRVGEVSAERNGMTHPQGKSEKRPGAYWRDVDGLCRTRDRVRLETYLAADRLELRQSEPGDGLLRRVPRVGDFGGGAEDCRDLRLGVSAFNHGRKIMSRCRRGKSG
jgi:hypothetical protein